MKGSKLIALATAIALVLLAVGCTAAQPAAQLPDGTFTAGPSDDQVETTLAAGRYKSTLVSVLNTSVIEEGTFVVKDDQITFTQEKASGALAVVCGSTDKPYTYKWTFDQQAKTITFVNVDDPCDARRSRRESGPLPYKAQTK